MTGGAELPRPRFGTDGLRGRAGQPPLDRSTLRRVAAAIGIRLQRAGGGDKRIVVGHDGRASAGWIRDCLVQGLAATDCAVADVGLCTTPALAHVTRLRRFAAGIMISASHNPADDNGIKLFGPEGRKLPAAEEDAISDLSTELALDEETSGRARPQRELLDLYVDHLLAEFPRLDLAGVRIVVDAANGGGAELAPRVLRGFGAEVDCIACAPDGTNINAGCGALHPEQAAARVRQLGAQLGLCLDGDGDRGIFVDDSAAVRDGDEVLALLGPAMLRAGQLPTATVVATEMSNLGLEEALRAHRIELLRTRVGDKWVTEAMAAGGHGLGGEQSGHIVFAGTDHAIGDGLYTALRLLALPERRTQPFSTLFGTFRRRPQILRNVAVARRPDLASIPAIRDAAARVEQQLGSGGRLLLRYSGTEPKCRVMIEASDAALAERLAAELADVIAAELAQ